MRKVLCSIAVLIVSFLCISSVVDAETYKRGIFVASSTLYENAGGQKLMSVYNTTITPTAPEAVEVIGESGNYYQIRLMWSGFQYVGYVAKSSLYVKEYTLDESYKQWQMSRGFPEDYARRITILHAIHPNWVFTPSFTGNVQGGLDFNYAVSREMSPVHNNLIDPSVKISLRSTADGAYSNGVWKTFAGGWYPASQQAVAFYMDPRNFLDESHVFMFENQAMNPAINYRVMTDKALADSPFMGNGKYFTCSYPYITNCTVGDHTYLDTFLEVGSATNLNPVHLVARVKKEQGNGTSPLASGLGYKEQDNVLYAHYYNYFNIRANGSTQADVIKNGLDWAQRQKWDNPYASILGGAKVIGGEYIYKGQSNNYYQKFDTIQPTYSHQYMQNIQAPYQEAYTAYTANYKSFATREEWDNYTYEFLIPIYQNMGAATSLDSRYNSDTTLSSLSIPECRFNMDFMSSAREYECYVEKNVTTLNISASATNSFAKTEYPSVVTLTSDEYTISINVIASDGSAQPYIVNVHRIDKSAETPVEILNKVSYKVTGEYVSNIAFQSDVSNIINSIRSTTPFADVKVVDTNGQVITGGTVKSGQIITISNAGVSASFKTVIYGDINSDNRIDILDLLLIQKHILKSKLLTDVSAVSADLNWDGKIDILDLLVIQKYILGAGIISQG